MKKLINKITNMNLIKHWLKKLNINNNKKQIY